MSSYYNRYRCHRIHGLDRSYLPRSGCHDTEEKSAGEKKEKEKERQEKKEDHH